MIRRPPRSTRTDTLFPYTTLFRSNGLLSRGFYANLPGDLLLKLNSLTSAQRQDDGPHHTIRESEMGSTGRESRGWVAGAGPGSPFMRGRIEGIADVEAIESMPARSVLSGETVYDCLVAAARIDPAKTAIVALAPGGSGDVDAILTYGDYLRHTDRKSPRLNSSN